jgi:uncharacterized tellurite resistance protein B-like protein
VFDRLLKFLENPAPPPPKQDELQLCVAVLLVEAARMDDRFDGAERGMIDHLLEQKFGLSAEERHRLLATAEETAKHSSQLHPFTRTAFTRMEPEERCRLIEMLWEVAYADGVLDPEEDLLLRRVAGLIYVSDHDRIAARQRVLKRLGKT